MTSRIAFLFLLLTAAPLAAQELACTVAGDPRFMRAEVAAEYVGHIDIGCRGGTPTLPGNPIPQYTIQVSLNTPITSRVTASPSYSEALLLVSPAWLIYNHRYCTEASCLTTAGDARIPNVFQARQTSANTLTFPGIPIDPPGPTGFVSFSLTNIRVNAAALAATPGASIYATVSITGPAVIPLSNPRVFVGTVLPGVVTSVSQSVAGYPQCNAVDTTAGPTNVLRFREAFEPAFRRRNIIGPGDPDTALTPIAQNDILRTYFTETNFYNPNPTLVAGPDTNLASAGLADHGTRLVARFTNIPAGVSLTAPLYSLAPTLSSAARLVNASPDGSGPFSAADSGNLPIVDGTATAVWEVMADTTSGYQTLEFPIGVTYPPGVPTGTISVATAIAPGATGTPRPLLSILPCNVSALTPAAETVPGAGVTGNSITVTAPGSWTASADVPWLTLTGTTSGSGNGTLTYNAAANDTRFTRTGVISVSGWTVIITQPAATGILTIDRDSEIVGPSAGSGTLTVSGPAGSAWYIDGGASFLTFSRSSGFGPAVIHYSYTANLTAVTRTAVARIGGSVFQLSQAGIPAVPITLSPSSDSVPMAGAIGRTIHVAANPHAVWNAVGDPPRVNILSGASGTGNGTVTYSVAPTRTRDSRQYAITISDQTFLIDQSGPSASNTGPIAGAGSTNTFEFDFYFPAGAENLDIVNFLVNTTLDGNQACYIAYSHPHRVLYLVNDGGPGSGLSAGLRLGATGSVSNSQCTVFSEGSFVVGGSFIHARFNIQFKPSFAGAKVLYVAARDARGEANSGWFTRGVWTVPGAPVSYPRPASLTAVGSTTTLVFEDETSADNLQTVWALVNTAVDGRAACYVAYHVPSNRLFLVPDNGDSAQAPSRPWTYPETSPLENSQCRVTPAAEVIKSGKRLYLSLTLAPKTGFFGPRAIWTAVQNLAGQVSPWTAAGAIFPVIRTPE
jgi:hypothetical protein